MIYYPMDIMLGDYMTKPLIEPKFVKFRYLIMDLSNKYHQVGKKECGGELCKKH